MVGWKKGRRLLRAHEDVVLDALGKALPPAARRLLGEQIAEVRTVQRLRDGCEVNLYAGRGGSARWSEECRFPNQTTELRLATVRLAAADGTPGTAEFWAVKGHVFEILFRPSPKQLGGPVEATGVTVHADPLEQTWGPSTADLIRRIPAHVRSELERLWATGPRQPLLGRDDLFAFDHNDGAYVMLAQLQDTTFVAVRLDPPTM